MIIRSDPGVRSDLFRRPLNEALITDFFGGVVQAEVVEDGNEGSGYAASSPSIKSETGTTNQPDGSLVENIPEERSPVKYHYLLEDRSDRAWAGVGLVGLLVGLVGYVSL